MDLMNQGMDAARLNFSHGTPETHQTTIQRIRSAAAALEHDCLILADLPGPKIRLGAIENEPVMLKKGQVVTLTTESVAGTAVRLPVNYPQLPVSVTQGSPIYLDDGYIQLTVRTVNKKDVECHIDVGGAVHSFKGLNLPDAKLFLDPITEQDLDLFEFGLTQGIDTFCVSFVEKAEDIRTLRDVAARQGRRVHLIAKIERREAVDNIDEILEVADGVMIARGDLGVQMPIEDIPRIQKSVVRKANLRGRPVITATQMLESMTHNIRPTRAEVTDVANAILDGTDAVMLSGETAVGDYPVETVAMMAKIATSIEAQRETQHRGLDTSARCISTASLENVSVEDVIAYGVRQAINKLTIHCIIAPTHSGSTPRCISRLKPTCWIFAFTEQPLTHHFLILSYGVKSFKLESGMVKSPRDVVTAVKARGLAGSGDTIVITEGISSGQTGWTNSLRILTLDDQSESETRSGLCRR
jgi:pyruvate kinase